MQHTRRKCLIPAIAVAAVLLLGASAVGSAGPDDTARFLAGLPPAPSSPLSAAGSKPAWRRHAAEMSAAWAAFETRQLKRVRVWAAAKLPEPRLTMFYMFGGPDFVHADAFFPNATTYVLSGLEPVGRLPDASTLPPAALDGGLESLQRSLKHFMQYGYFITSQMGKQFRFGKFNGTLPVLSVFLVRSAKTIRKVEFVTLNGEGEPAPVRGKRRPTGVKISFSGADGQLRTLFYFSTNLTNAGVAKSRFLKFCARLGQGNSLVKSASYLMHVGNFSKVREFLLRHSAVIVQDDSGIPLRYFKTEDWRLHPYGRYVGPTDEFKRFHQADLVQLFRTGGAERVNFGIGYRWHHQRTNILVAERQAARPPDGR